MEYIFSTQNPITDTIFRELARSDFTKKEDVITGVLSLCRLNKKFAAHEICKPESWDNQLKKDLAAYPAYLYLIDPPRKNLQYALNRYFNATEQFKSIKAFLADYKEGFLFKDEIEDKLSDPDFTGILLYLFLHDRLEDSNLAGEYGPIKSNLFYRWYSLNMDNRNPPDLFYKFFALFALLAHQNNDQRFLNEITEKDDFESDKTYKAICDMPGFSTKLKNKLLSEIRVENWEKCI